MRLLIAAIVLAVCATMGCAETPAEKAATGYHPNAHLARGGPRDGFDFKASQNERSRLIREVPRILDGTSADRVIALLGEPDSDYVGFEHIFGEVHGRDLVYYLAIYRFGGWTMGTDQSITLHFDNENHFHWYRADNVLELPTGPEQPATTRSP